MTVAARAKGLTKTYGSGDAVVTALDGVDFEVFQGEFTAIMGPSGSGKSTLMHLMAALDTPTAGEVWIGDTAVGSLADTPLTKLRRERVGFVFQAFNLVPTLTARENIVLPAVDRGQGHRRGVVRRIVDVLGLRDRLTHKPSELSGGQQQRVACARALMNRPDIVFGDEPTGNLDSASAAEVLTFLRRSVNEFNQTVVMVTHDAHAASYADRIVFLSDGRIVDDSAGPRTPTCSARWPGCIRRRSRLTPEPEGIFRDGGLVPERRDDWLDDIETTAERSLARRALLD